ncbi:hypothetical protein [Streptomyces sp. NPDC050564]|uniref:hypothetical protein n=1 Tax=Streptomyces sp. NPDC050564 TaxID=3365631 RepID=UPI0037A0C399
MAVFMLLSPRTLLRSPQVLRVEGPRTGSDYAARFITPDGLWQQWTRDKSPDYLEAQKNRVADLRALVKEARQADPVGTDDRAVSLPAGWVLIPGKDRTVFEAELAMEVSADLRPNHPLAECPLQAVAHCSQRDHVLFEIAENPIRWALVQLSWSGQAEHGIRPHWQFFASTETATTGLREHMR